MSDAELRYVNLLRKPVKTKDEMQELERLRGKLVDELREEVSELVDDLRSVGVFCRDIWDLVNTKEPYPSAIPILIRYLDNDFHYRNKEAIVRALGVKEAIGLVAPRLINEYHNTPLDKESYRDAIGNAVFVTFTSADVAAILQIVEDKRNGSSRFMFVGALGRIKGKSDKVESVLLELLNNEDQLLEAAVRALGGIRSQRAKGFLLDLLPTAKPNLKKVILAALKRIG
jgi:hypothetical protein